jgi:hypothetical protein
VGYKGVLPKINQVNYNLWCQQPAAKLAATTISKLSQNAKLKTAFKMAFTGYQKEDWQSLGTPALSMAYKKVRSTGNMCIEEGTLDLRIYFPQSVVREKLHETTAVMVDGISTIFRDYPFFDSVLKETPGLRSLGNTLTWSPEKVENISDQNVKVLSAEIDFWVDLLVWNRYIDSVLGVTAMDPCVQIYGTYTNFLLEVRFPPFPEEE